MQKVKAAQPQAAKPLIPGQLVRLRDSEQRVLRSQVRLWALPGHQRDYLPAGWARGDVVFLIVAVIDIKDQRWCMVLSDKLLGWTCRDRFIDSLEADVTVPPQVVG